MKNCFAILLLLTTIRSAAQDDAQQKPSLSFSGFIEAYYGYDFNQPNNNKRPPFVYSHNRHNEVNVNLAFVKAAYTTNNVRANLTLAAGTYMSANYAAEPDVIKNIYEANVGVKLLKKRNLWIDAGIMQSHIGFESAHTPSCWTLTRSILADNSPYFESGAKLGYTNNNGKWYIAGMVLNGWQRIYRPTGYKDITGGTQLTFTPSTRLTLNYSTFIGNTYPSNARRMRIFNDLYAIVNFTDKFGMIAGIDFGLEQKSKNSDKWNKWAGAAIIMRYKTAPKTAIAARGEYYIDNKGVIIPLKKGMPFNASGFSADFDYNIRSNVLWRIEGKGLITTEAVFTPRSGEYVKNDFVAATSLSISF